MKVFIAGAAALVALWTAGPAYADPDSNEGSTEGPAQRYTDQLRAIGVYPDSVRGAVDQAHAICGRLAAGESPVHVAHSLGDGPTEAMVHVTAQNYCPGKA